jgi:hypothetical protein
MKELYDLVVLVGFINNLAICFVGIILERRINNLRDDFRNEIRNLKDKQ